MKFLLDTRIAYVQFARIGNKLYAQKIILGFVVKSVLMEKLNEKIK